jgi:putative DNA primase/helicase
MRIYVDLEYNDREPAAKALGKKVKWDPEAKCSFVTSKKEYEKIKHLLSDRNTAPAGAIKYTSDPHVEFKAFLEQYGLIIEGLPIMDNSKQRVKVQGKSSKAGEYKGYTDGRPAGYVRNYMTSEYKTWKYTGQIDESLMPSKAEIAQSKFDKALEKRKTQKEVAKKAQLIWDGIDLEDMPKEHPYLSNKGIEIHGARISEKGLLVIPLKDNFGNISNLQFINEDGSKMFMKGGSNEGCFFQIGYIGERSTIILCEGFSTGATLNELLNRPVICAINAGNLVKVAEVLREKYPYNKIVIAADDDRNNKENAGLLKAEATKKALEKNISIVIPTFENPGEKDTDWNDHYKKYGSEKSIEDLSNQGLKPSRKRKGK